MEGRPAKINCSKPPICAVFSHRSGLVREPYLNSGSNHDLNLEEQVLKRSYVRRMSVFRFKARCRHAALQATLVVTVPAALLFAILHLQVGAIDLAVLNLLLALYSAVFLLIAHSHDVETQLPVSIYLLLLLSIVLLAFPRPDIHTYAYTWLSVLPVLAYLLLEPRRAFCLTGTSLLLALVVISLTEQPRADALDTIAIADIAIPVTALFIVCHFYSRSQLIFESRLQEQIVTDPLTGLWNRTKLMDDFNRVQQRSVRMGTPLSLIMVDLDNFKQLNDRYGHGAGDLMLVLVAQLLQERSRQADLLFRVGGEEFVVLLPDTNIRGAAIVAETLRGSLEEKRFITTSRR